MALKPTEFTISGLSVEFGRDPKTIGKILDGLEPHRKKGRYKYYYLKDVVNHMMSKGGEKLDAQQEQAKLNQSRRLKVDFEREVAEGQHCETEWVKQFWFDHITNCKTRLRGIPHKYAHRVMAASNHAEALQLLEEGVDEALSELADECAPGKSDIGVSKQGMESAA